jgi:predicted Fe-Mo cluster-binding NifX family protein
MTLIPLEKDQITISGRFRKADFFAFLNEGEITIEKNPHKKSKSPEFFEYFKTLNVDTLCIKELGYKTFLKLLELNVEVYLVEEADTFDDIRFDKLLLLDEENAKEYCSLGHDKKA